MLYRFLFVVYCICFHIRSVFFQYKNPNVRWCYGLLRRMTELRCAVVQVVFINQASHNPVIFVCRCTISDFILKIYFRIKSKVYPSTSNDGLFTWGISWNILLSFNTFMQRFLLLTQLPIIWNANQSMCPCSTSKNLFWYPFTKAFT